MSPARPALSREVRDAARANDHERYLAALLAPEAVRDDLVTLTAFAGEIAQVPFLVSEPMLGEIRLQWWADALVAPAGTQTGNPVADGMRGVLARRGIDVTPALRLVEARMADCYADPIPDEAALSQRLLASEGNVIRLWLTLAGEDCRSVSDLLIHDAAIALGTTRLLGALPRHLARGRVPLPLTWLAGLPADVVELALPKNKTRLVGAVAQACAFAAAHHAKVRATPPLSRACRTALLALALIEPQLRALTRGSHDPLHDLLELSPLQRIWRLWRAQASGRV